jgi:hypothetical protein
VVTQSDIDLIKSTRSEIEQNRKEPVTLYRETVTGTDPYTGEPIVSETTENVNAVVSGFHSVVGGERLIVNGIAIQEGDVKLSLGIAVNLEGVKKVVIGSVEYYIYSVMPRGLGTDNRYEVVLRRVVQR